MITFLKPQGHPKSLPHSHSTPFQEEVISLGAAPVCSEPPGTAPGQQGAPRLYTSLVSHLEPSLNTWTRPRTKNNKKAG